MGMEKSLEVLGEEVVLHESSIGWSGSPILPEEREMLRVSRDIVLPYPQPTP